MFSRIAIAAALVAGASAPALAFAGWHGHWMGPWGGFLFLLVVVTLVVLGITVFGASRRRAFPTAATAAAGPVPRASGSAFTILSERFARGDIDAGEYEARRRVLAGEPAPEPNPSPAPPAPPAA